MWPTATTRNTLASWRFPRSRAASAVPSGGPAATSNTCATRCCISSKWGSTKVSCTGFCGRSSKGSKLPAIMSRWLEGLEDRLSSVAGLGPRLDAMIDALQDLGFTSLGYDYTPVPMTPEGDLIPPSLLEIRNIDAEMPELWTKGGFCQIDPMQELAVRANAPFMWSCNKDAVNRGRDPQQNALVGMVTDRHQPVIHYLKDTRMTI